LAATFTLKYNSKTMAQSRNLTLSVLTGLIFLVYSCSCNNNSDKQKESMGQTESNNGKYIKNFYAAYLYDPLQKKGFKIDKQIESDAIFINCDRTMSEFGEHVRISGDDYSKIIEIRASYANYSTGKINNLAKSFLGFIATMPYENANPEQARKWVEDNISKNSKIDINGVTFEIIGNSKNIRTLLVTPTE
jgi:hypothetical protein